MLKCNEFVLYSSAYTRIALYLMGVGSLAAIGYFVKSNFFKETTVKSSLSQHLTSD